MKNTRLEQLKAFLEEQPNDPFLKYALATEYQKLEKLQMARELFEELRRMHPDYLGTYYHLGKLYEQLGEVPAGLECYQQGIRLARQQGQARTLSELQAAWLLAGGDPEEAEGNAE